MVAKKKRRVSLGLAIDAETGEVINNAQRQSGAIPYCFKYQCYCTADEERRRGQEGVFIALPLWDGAHRIT
jgi:hypothetical protein